MAALSGLCPQRRITKGGDSEQFILVGDSYVRADLRDGASLEHLTSFKDTDTRHNWWSSSKSFARVVLIIVFSLMLSTVLFIHGSGVLLLRANHLGRQCIDVRERSHTPRKYHFAMVTCSDGSKTIPHRSFEGLMDLVTPNKQSYVERHGYDFIDASDVLDRNRPPSWSKILAMKKHLPNYEWVFWNDADSVVTNPSITLEGIIDSIVGDLDWQHMPDLIVTKDVTGVNAGMFFMRNTEWSRQFLDLWWNQTSFVEPFGLCKSGDNSALKHIIATMPEAERRQHVRIPPMQCVFNSNLWRPSWRNSHRLVTFTRMIWQGVYAKGDFMVHLAGLNDKKRWVQKVLQDIKEDRAVPRDKYQSNRKALFSHRH
ncbi:hypothetical protein Mapa_007727 [Marchantia paleacea]|nr:hypothetical protein Mapa_007727 [Marchantia paleacea]